MHIKKGDTVKILSGAYKGKTGKVLFVLPKRNRAIVESVNFVKRHSRPTQQNPQGGRKRLFMSQILQLLPMGKLHVLGIDFSILVEKYEYLGKLAKTSILRSKRG